MKLSIIAAVLFALSIGNASAQVPTFEDGAWVMPAHESHAAPAAQGGGTSKDSIVAMVYEVCANEGCLVSPETMIGVIECETAGTWSHDVVGPNGELGILQIDPRYHPYDVAHGSPYTQIEYAAKHLGGDVYWDCL